MRCYENTNRRLSCLGNSNTDVETRVLVARSGTNLRVYRRVVHADLSHLDAVSTVYARQH
jgi:hypothetical protein